MAFAPALRTAEQLYETGYALFQHGHYEQALVQFKMAEEAFRRIDVRGHAFMHPLNNGISGLANTLALEGDCYQRLGDRTNAVRCYETSLINAKFERKRPFRRLLKRLRENLIACYEEELRRWEPATLHTALRQDPGLDTSYAFPYSLDPPLIPLARLYELDAGRYPQFRDLYERTKQKDRRQRQLTKTADETTVLRLSVAVWTMLSLLWLGYAFIVFRTLTAKH